MSQRRNGSNLVSFTDIELKLHVVVESFAAHELSVTSFDTRRDRSVAVYFQGFYPNGLQSDDKSLSQKAAEDTHSFKEYLASV